MNSEKEDLDNLLKHPGWLRIVTAEEEWWQEQMSAQLEQCANDGDDVKALNKMRQIIAAKRAVERFIARPRERLTKLRAEADSKTFIADALQRVRGGYHA